MAIWLARFLKRATNIGKVVIKGKGVKRGNGYGLEILCEYQFMGDAFSISWLKEKLQKEGFDAKVKTKLEERKRKYLLENILKLDYC